eukprot:1462730-Lingulodinium_polyedra.AAC.1
MVRCRFLSSALGGWALGARKRSCGSRRTSTSIATTSWRRRRASPCGGFVSSACCSSRWRTR